MKDIVRELTASEARALIDSGQAGELSACRGVSIMHAHCLAVETQGLEGPQETYWHLVPSSQLIITGPVVSDGAGSEIVQSRPRPGSVLECLLVTEQIALRKASASGVPPRKTQSEPLSEVFEMPGFTPPQPFTPPVVPQDVAASIAPAEMAFVNPSDQALVRDGNDIVASQTATSFGGNSIPTVLSGLVNAFMQARGLPSVVVVEAFEKEGHAENPIPSLADGMGNILFESPSPEMAPLIGKGIAELSDEPFDEVSIGCGHPNCTVCQGRTMRVSRRDRAVAATTQIRGFIAHWTNTPDSLMEAVKAKAMGQRDWVDAMGAETYMYLAPKAITL